MDGDVRDAAPGHHQGDPSSLTDAKMESFLVFGRTDYAEPLAELGLLEADGPREAEAASIERFGEQWVELSLVPESTVVWVLNDARKDGHESDGD